MCSVSVVIRELADNGLAGYPLESVAFTGATIPSSFFQSVRKGFPQTRVYVHDLTLFDDIDSPPVPQTTGIWYD